MCGISGFWGDFPADLLDRMNEVQRHRGPDDAGVWLGDGGVGLAHRRLSILDLSPRGHQPMATPDGRLRVVFNGEIYNYPELRAEMEGRGVRFVSDSDTEVLLHLYREDGPDFVRRLNGIFAFALWDDTRRTLWLARDGWGIKPLYLAHCAPGLLFASELKAILQSPSVSRTLRPEAAMAHAAFLWCPSPWTMLADVEKVEPGTMIEIREGEVASRRSFYRIPYRALEAMNERPDTGPTHVREALRTAVKRQLLADVPVGAFLSGGLDSSSIVAFASQELGSRGLPCFTIDLGSAGAEEGISDDLGFARKVAKHLNVELHVTRATPDIAEHLERMIWHLDEPQGDFAAINTWLIASLARQEGIKVLLSGAGGDDLFSGYRRHLGVGWDAALNRTPRLLRRVITRAAGALPNNNPTIRRVKRAARDLSLGEADRLLGWFAWESPTALQGLAGETMRQVPAWSRVVAQLGQTLGALPPGAPPLERMLALETRHFLADHNLNYTDKLGMAASVEIRVPFLDADLVDLACRIPPPLKVHQNEAKWVLKKAMEGILPDEVIYRAKAGFGVPLRQWFTRGQLPPILDDALSPGAIARRGLFEPGAVGRLMAETRSGRSDGAYVLMSLATIELWCRRFVDSTRPS